MNGLRINIFILIFMISQFFVLTVFAGTIDSSDRYAWSENVGWIDFGTTQGNINVTDSELTGYAWSENIGWISLNCSNTSSCSTVNYKVVNDGTGILSGYAWSENAGWIDFKPTNGGVTINSSGEFLGYAWSETTGWIVFNCTTTNSCSTVSYKVKTDWRPVSTNTSSNWVPPVYNNPKPPLNGFSLKINNDEKVTKSNFVKLFLDGGDKVIRMAISNSSDFLNVGQENYSTVKNWDLCKGKAICNPGIYVVYVKFYSPWGKSTEVVFDSIEYKKSDIPSGFTFTKNLKLGMKGLDIKYLQIVLNQDKDTLIAKTGLGSLGKETLLFGSATKKAVIKFQEKYRKEILEPFGLKRGNGFVGKATRDKLNEILN